VFGGVELLQGVFPGSPDPRVDRKIFEIHRKAVSQLVDRFVKELPDIAYQVVVVAGESPAIFEGRADLLDG
jgi:hypothetical protein